MDPICSSIFPGAKSQCNTNTGGGNTGGGGGGSSFSGAEAGEDDNNGFCQSNQSLCMMDDFRFMAPTTIFAKNLKQPQHRMPISIANISDEECVTKYVSFLNQDMDSDDFIIYA